MDDDWGGADWLYLWGVGWEGAVLSTCMLGLGEGLAVPVGSGVGGRRSEHLHAGAGLGLGEGPTISCTLLSVPSGQYFWMTHNWFCCGYM